MGAWSGAAFDSKRDRLMVWGGGHNDYGGNEIYAFDIVTLSWSIIWGPSPNIPPPYQPCHETYSDGNPVARHTYDGLEYVPGTDTFWIFGGALYCDNGAAARDTWGFDLTALTWSRLADVVPPGIWTEHEAVSAYDPVTGHVFMSSPSLALYEYDPSADKWTQRSDSDIGYGKVAAIDPARRKFVAIGLGQVLSYDISRSGSLTLRTLQTTGDTSILDKTYPGFVYNPVIEQFVAWSGGSDVFLLDIDTLVWRKQPARGGVVPGPSAKWGTYGRFRYVPSKDVFVAVNSIDDNVYIYRMDTPEHKN
jgi:hypothetical protein